MAVTAASCMLLVLCSSHAPGASVPGTPAARPVERPAPVILNAGGADLLRMLGKEIEVTGYYYGGSVPMLVDDMERVAINLPLPPGSFVPLVGARPAGLKWGDQVRARGLLRKPAPADSPKLSGTPAVLQIEREAHLSVVRAAAVREAITGSVRTFPKPESIRRIERLGKQNLTPGNKYAVLFAGGGSVESNHIRYWNDLTVMYDILIASGYQAGDITVIYADGLPPDDTTEGKRASDMPVDFVATRGNIQRAFDGLQRVVGPKDTVFIMTNDHGGGCLTLRSGSLEPGLYGCRIDDNDDELLDRICEGSVGADLNRDGDRDDCVKVDESFSLWQSNRPMYDDEFAAEVAKLSNCGRIILVAEQCFSGGFLDDLTGPNRVMMSAADDVQISRARRPGLLYNEFTFWFMSALTGLKPDGTGSVDADADGNGRVSVGEAYNFAVANDSTDERPCFEDNGLRSFIRGAIPAGQEGVLGMRTYL